MINQKQFSLTCSEKFKASYLLFRHGRNGRRTHKTSEHLRENVNAYNSWERLEKPIFFIYKCPTDGHLALLSPCDWTVTK